MQAISYFLKDTANSWYQSLVNKPQDFNAFKVEFLKYFSNNNSINCLVNTFTTMEQGETEAVITYLRRFHQNLCQVQAIDANYFTAPQILNQFIRDAVTCARDFESTESEANHAQTVNLVMNGSSELNSKLKNLHNDAIIKETLIVPKINHVYLHQPINSGNRKRISAIIVVNKDISKLTVAILKSKPTRLSTSDTVISLSISSVSSSNLSTAATSNLSTTAATNNLSAPTNPNTTPKLTTQQNPKTKNDLTELEIILHNNHLDYASGIRVPNYLSLLVTPKDASTNNSAFAQKQPLTSNISPATITEDKSLATIFPFEFEKTTAMLLFSGATLEAKPITAMYTDTKVERQSIKLILNSADGVTKTPISEINNFPFEVNGIMTPIKVLVMEATQYQALIATCGHFKTPSREKLLIELEEEKKKLTWEAYQVSWADADHNELPPILSWNDNPKGKQKEELIWETDNLTWTDNEQEEPSSWEWKEEKGKKKKSEEENTQANNTYIPYTYGQQQLLTYC
ncbi:hypothetical protein G9A89_017476 [Geosiphon pyriformis]|nr:hypothetical protein G9A89_017476 [Geosiphon pyriformis]